MPELIPLAEFVETVLLNDLRRMIEEAKLHYLAFVTIAVGIEFLGACYDDKPFVSGGSSRKRFERGITQMTRIDPRYTKYKKKGKPHCLYDFLRCGTAHIMRPQGSIVFSERKHWEGKPSVHLTEINGKLILICEDLYEHFAASCQNLLQELPLKTSTKFQNPYLWVGPVK